MLFARWQHHLRFCSGFPYAPLKAMVSKISKWSRIQNSFRITLNRIESLVVCAIPDIPSKFQKDPSITFWVILLTHRQTDGQTKSSRNITSLAEVIINANTLSVINVYAYSSWTRRCYPDNRCVCRIVYMPKCTDHCHNETDWQGTLHTHKFGQTQKQRQSDIHTVTQRYR